MVKGPGHQDQLMPDGFRTPAAATIDGAGYGAEDRSIVDGGEWNNTWWFF
jgi:hypothetical protein